MLGRHRMYRTGVRSRHRRGWPLVRRRLRISASIATLAAVVVVGAVAVHNVSADASSCVGSVRLNVTVTPEIAPSLRQIAEDWTATRPQVNTHCVEVAIVPIASSTVASQLATAAGGSVDIEEQVKPIDPADRPDVWVPDSTAWLGRVQAVDHTEFTADPRSIATSPIVFAMPVPQARQVGWPTMPLQLAQLEQQLRQGTSTLTMAIADPHRDTPGLVATMLLGESLAATDGDLPALVRTFRGLVKARDTADVLPIVGRAAMAAPAAEQAVVAYDNTHPPISLAAVQLEPTAPNLDYPYAVRSEIEEDHRQAANDFRAVVLSPPAQARLAQAAFRDPEGRAGPGFPPSSATTTAAAGAFAVADPERVQNALNLWAAVNEPPQALALFDVTASMKTPAAGGLTRAGVMVAAADQGFKDFSSESRVGVWTFGATHQDVLPFAPLTQERQIELKAQIAAAAPTASDRSELYTTVGDAYEAVQRAYDPGRPNFIIVFTDGGDSSPGGERLADFTSRIERLSDPTKPIRIIVIGIGVPAAAAVDLQAVADTIGGGYFPLSAPAQVESILLQALLAVGEA